MRSSSDIAHESGAKTGPSRPIPPDSCAKWAVLTDSHQVAALPIGVHCKGVEGGRRGQGPRRREVLLCHHEVGCGKHFVAVPLQGQEDRRSLRVRLVEHHVASVDPGVALSLARVRLGVVDLVGEVLVEE